MARIEQENLSADNCRVTKIIIILCNSLRFERNKETYMSRFGITIASDYCIMLYKHMLLYACYVILQSLR